MSRKVVTIITVVASAIAVVILVTVVIAVVIGSGNEDNTLDNKESLTEKQIDTQKNTENLANQNTTTGTKDGQSKSTGIFFKVLDVKIVPSFRMAPHFLPWSWQSPASLPPQG